MALKNGPQVEVKRGSRFSNSIFTITLVRMKQMARHLAMHHFVQDHGLVYSSTFNLPICISLHEIPTIYDPFQPDPATEPCAR